MNLSAVIFEKCTYYIIYWYQVPWYDTPGTCRHIPGTPEYILHYITAVVQEAAAGEIRL